MIRIIIPLCVLALLAGCGKAQPPSPDAAEEAPSQETTPPAADEQVPDPVAQDDAAPPAEQLPEGSPPTQPPSELSPPAPMTVVSVPFDGSFLTGEHHVVLHTSKGDIRLVLDANRAPKTVTNFIGLAESGFYNGLTFHRVIPGFMIQGGDPNGDGTGSKSLFGEKFEDEIDTESDLYKDGYKRGVLAMANSGENTNGCQFFIMQADYPLPPNYTIFGRTEEGTDAIDTIAVVPTNAQDRPIEAVTFTVEVVD